MSAPAQVTEAHRVLARHLSTEAESVPHLCDLMAQAIADSEAQAVASALSNVTCTHHNDMARAECPVCLVAALRAERDQLLQQVANLKYSNHYHRKTAETSRATETDRNNLRADLDAIKAILTEEKDRASRAEAELAGIRALADRRNERDHSQDTTHQLVAALDQALDSAQAELAQFRELDAERARMRQIAVDKRIRTPTPRTDEEAGSLIDAEEVVPADFSRELERELAKERARLDWVISSQEIWLGSKERTRAAIDAAMKEGA